MQLYCRAVGHSVTECPDAEPCNKCKQKGHHHLHSKNKYSQVTPEENETMIIANAINTLNQVSEATENKVFKHQLQNQLLRLYFSVISHSCQIPALIG
ncbi:unnamed protein product [Ambrosiozyma monospora]|uniref:Unnamed protein product n=1 Tax=Ambrosiozyma monospora TaxID=43982 RepID=A0A9W7DIA4_AMBMO|nr:unnamed protein product [Ambrosiozyma monospora]